MKPIEEVAASPCATCPWRRSNQTAAARRTSPKADGARHRWFSVANLRRLWSGARDGHPTICHATDPNAPEYGGKEAKTGHERICIGALILVTRAMDDVNRRMERGQKTFVGMKFSRNGLLYWVEAAVFRGTPLGHSTRVMPIVFDDSEEIRVPWTDDVLNLGALAEVEP